MDVKGWLPTKVVNAGMFQSTLYSFIANALSPMIRLQCVLHCRCSLNFVSTVAVRVSVEQLLTALINVLLYLHVCLLLAHSC
jgi:hypothetical protein